MKIIGSLILTLVAYTFCCAQASNQATTSVHIIFQNIIGGSLMNKDSVYQNHFDEPFKIRTCKYYISHVQLQYNNAKYYPVKASPHLINEDDSLSKSLSFAAPSGKITGIKFLLGIDSITNTSGVQTGDLDPANGMFWIWNTGYIMARLEGTSTVSKAPAKRFNYDVGGYKPGENAAREIDLSIPSGNHQNVSSFIITADLSKWFYGKHDIKINEEPMCHSPGSLAMQIADNYASMFSIEER